MGDATVVQVTYPHTASGNSPLTRPVGPDMNLGMMLIQTRHGVGIVFLMAAGTALLVNRRQIVPCLAGK